jgi:hypothetical protein
MLITMSCSWVLCRAYAIAFFRDAGSDRLTLVKAERHRWQEARPADRSLRFINIDVLLWALKNILGSCDQVRDVITFKDPRPDRNKADVSTGH